MNSFAAGAQPVRTAVPARRVTDSLALRALAFFALAAFASFAYGELLLHPPAARLLALAAIATAGCATLAAGRADGRPALPAAARPVAVVATLLLSLLALGVPAHLLAPSGWGRLVRHVGDGVDGLGAWLWPYRGGARWSRLAVLLVVPFVLIAAGALCFWPGTTGGRVRRTAAAAMLVGLFLTGAANTPQSEPGLRGLVLLFLIAFWLWAPRGGQGGALRAARWLIVPALVALALRPALSSSSAWIGFRETAAATSAEASFQWDQRYGPITWARTDAPMLTVAAAHPGLLRVTSLDRFDGLRFLRSDAAAGNARIDLGGRPNRRWLSQEIVTVAGLRSRLLLGGDGVPLTLRWISGAPLVARESDGTLAAAAVLTGGSYEVTSYRPRPSVAQLRRAPRRFPRAYLPYARFALPPRGASALIQPRFAAEARAPVPAGGLVGPSAPGRALATAAAARVQGSPYGPMFALARSLARGASADYDIAERIKDYLLANYRYDEHVPLGRYPLEAFLFEQRRGYCQQFSGAMTLMLRMDGIPARVAAGFKPTVYDPVSATWKLRARDAHSWVEVFFAGIGWVSFDPTPAAPITLPGAAAAAKKKSEILGGATGGAAGPVRLAAGAGVIAAARPDAGGAGPWVELGLGVAVLLASAVAGLWLRGHMRLRRALGGEAATAVAELRRVLDGLGGTDRVATLDKLERRLREG
ncbi:MAG TPA: transglutaminase-like domain-containing protein, partial [Solirubrobacteraceae bacterium]